MSHIIYQMQFKGTLGPVGTSPNVMKAILVANCIRMTVVGSDGLQIPLEPPLGKQATFESDVTFLGGFESAESTAAGEAGFKETGLITFPGGEHWLRFSTLGQGYIGPSPEPSLRQGAVLCQVESGEGQFKGAQGLIASNFIISDAGEVDDHHVGVIFVT
jgi:hypothetical protein